MRSDYDAQEKRLRVKFSADELKQTRDEVTKRAAIRGHESPELHGKTLSLVYAEGRNSPSASIVRDGRGFRLVLCPRNHIDILDGKEVTGRFEEGELKFNVYASRVEGY